MGVDRLDVDDGDCDARRPKAAETREVPAAAPAEPDSPGERTALQARLEAHAELRAKADEAYRAYAIDQGCDRVRETEETVVTPAMRRIESEDPSRTLTGLEFRLKGRDRLAEKVAEAIDERGHSVADAFGLVKDAIRYTFCYLDDSYAEGVLADCARLEAEGFERFDRKNSWEEDEYKGINTRWRDPGSGQLFEVQFHTQASYVGWSWRVGLRQGWPLRKTSDCLSPLSAEAVRPCCQLKSCSSTSTC